MREVLIGEVHSHQVAERGHQPTSDRAGYCAVPHRSAVNRRYRADAQTGGGQESFISGVGVVEVDIAFFGGHT